jgi:hypothetical protein
MPREASASATLDPIIPEPRIATARGCISWAPNSQLNFDEWLRQQHVARESFEPYKLPDGLGATATVDAGNLSNPEQVEFFRGRARVVAFPQHADFRGCLIPFAFEQLPFPPRHAFIVRDVPAGMVRGGHAHTNAHQLIICLAGRLSVELRDSTSSETVVLERPDVGLLIGAGLWAAQTYVSAETIMLVFASEPYDPGSRLDEALN